MIARVLGMALAALTVVVLLLSVPCRADAPVDVTGKPTLTLKDGTKIYFLAGFELRPEGGGPDDRTLAATFAFADSSMLAKHERLIEIADLLFGAIVVTAADTQGYKRALVGFVVSETQAGDKKVQQREDFDYARRDDAVWLRQAGTEPWKTAQNPNDWTPPKVELYDIGEYGTAEVSFFGEVAAIPGIFKILGVEMWTATQIGTGRKFEEIRALWNSLDRDKLTREGFNAAMLLNFEEKARGKFHVRKFAFYRILRASNGDWGKLPEGPLGPNGLPVVVASLQMPMPEGDAVGIAAAALMTAARPAAASEAPSVESAVASGGSLRLRAVKDDSGSAKSYRAKAK